MSLRLAAPARWPFAPVWMVVPLLLFVIALGACAFVGAPQFAFLSADLPADLPAELAALPPAA